ncbi:apolipoprotein N-acyltransferase [Microcoleus sp. FACHB-68]|uniref:apolipoprotein N-acyltransferase n=1 Tax=Microcoleus sp. FACHB-68 TaxID=2692826 RepID=UPI001F549D8F|nr:apolipoprotein N-acyltransferase [Microcoleus sp. FACHB-68]
MSGILMGLTPAPVGAWFLGWVALAPLWLLVVQESKQLKEKKEKKFLPLTALLWGIGYHGVALFWITGVHPMTWMGVPWLASLAIAFFCWVFITLWGAALVAIWATCFFWINRKFKVSTLVRVLTGTALWCILETIWSAGSLWWSSLSYTQSPNNLAILHLAQLAGPSAVTAALVAVNGLIAEAWIKAKNHPVKGIKANILVYLLPVSLCLFLHLLGFSLYSRPLAQPPADALKVGIIQGNIPNTIKLYQEGWLRAIEGYTTGYRMLADQGVDAILTPETALPVKWLESNGIRDELYQAILDKNVLAWVGAFGETGNSFTNSLFTVTGAGETFSRYDKIKLVPLGEFIPFGEVLGRLIDRLSPLDAHLAAGLPTQVFDTPFGRAIVGICYESAFSYHFQRQAALGGQFILTASNNAHYSPSMPAQHHAQDVMRAIETDRWAVRATNTGYSGIVDPHGKTVWISGINTYEIHAATIYRRHTQTLYVRWGDWLTPALFGLVAMACFFDFRTRMSVGS